MLIQPSVRITNITGNIKKPIRQVKSQHALTVSSSNFTEPWYKAELLKFTPTHYMVSSGLSKVLLA